MPEVYLWLYGGELAPVRLGVRPDYNIAWNSLPGKFSYLWFLKNMKEKIRSGSLDYRSLLCNKRLYITCCIC